MQSFIDQFINELQKPVELFKKEISTLKTGRATPAMVENLLIECYGQKMPLVQLASINSPDPKTLVIQPWDMNNLKEIEKSLTLANLGAMPAISENFIRLNFPSPTEESRKEIIKNLHKKLEEARINLKKVRENIRETIVAQEKNKEISEDEKFKFLEQLDDKTKNVNDELKKISDQKETDILII